MPERWTRDGWRRKPILQVPEYPDKAALEAVERQLATFPPLVFAGEARNLEKRPRPRRDGRGVPAAGRRLRRELSAQRQQFSADNIRDSFRVFLQMAVVLTFAPPCRW